MKQNILFICSSAHIHISFFVHFPVEPGRGFPVDSLPVLKENLSDNWHRFRVPTHLENLENSWNFMLDLVFLVY